MLVRNDIISSTSLYKIDDIFLAEIHLHRSNRLQNNEQRILSHDIIDEDKNTISISFNSNEIANNQEKMKETLIRQLQKTGESDFFCEKIAINTENLPFLPVSQINQLRRELFKNLMIERLKNYKRNVQKPLKYAPYPQNEMDFRANVHNKLAEKFYEKCGCKIVEKSFESTSNSKNKPLMTTKHCLKYALNMCKKPINLFLIDEKNQRYKLVFDCKNCQMQIFKD